jgi:hypothetical protein
MIFFVVVNADLYFGKTGDGLFGYVDSYYAGDLDKRSLSRYVFTMGDCAVSWKACSHATIVMSTTEDAYIY